jgi:hypothetical protein
MVGCWLEVMDEGWKSLDGGVALLMRGISWTASGGE